MLQLARQTNPKDYTKFGPYYNVPRKTFDRSRFEVAETELKQKKVNRALVKGVGFSALGSGFIVILYIAIAIITNSGFLAAWAWALLVPLARAVAMRVEKNLKGESQDLISKIAVRSYLIGFILSPIFIVTALFLIISVIV